jgi:hypothetical protein
MVRVIENGYTMSVPADDFYQLRQILTGKKWPSDFIVPDHLRGVTVMGGSGDACQGMR